MKAPDDATLQGLLDANESHCASYMAFLAGLWPGCTVDETPAGFFFMTGLPSLMANGVCRTRLSDDEAPAWILKAKRLCQERGLPMMWLVGRQTPPVALGEMLVTHGFRERPQRSMALDLGQTPVEAPDVPGLSITDATGDQGMRDFRLVCADFGADQATLDGYLQLLLAAGHGCGKPIRHFVGYLEGRPVSCSSLACFDGVAGVWNVVTLEDYRGRGIGTALTIHACFAGKARGYRYCVLSASRLGASVYRRIGFVDTGSQSMFMWRPGA